MRLKTLLLILFIVVGTYSQTKTIEINTDTQYQVIDNFGASDCWWAHKIGKLWSEANKDSLADLLFDTTKGIGLSAWRFNLGGGVDSTMRDPWRSVETFQTSYGKYDWTRNEGGQWFLKAAKDRGVDQFVAFVNSPPRSMTRNGHTYGTEGEGTTNLKDGCFTLYGEYLADIVKHFRDSLGIALNYVSPVNEPQGNWDGPRQEGNRASNDDIKKIVDSLYVVLVRRNISSNIIIPECSRITDWYTVKSPISSDFGVTYANFINTLMHNPAIAAKTVNILAGHSYWSDSLATELTQDRDSLYSYLDEYFAEGYKYWMTEYCILEGTEGQGGFGLDTTIITAIDVARTIHYDLTRTYASAWQWWLAVSNGNFKDGLLYTDCSPRDSLKQNIIIPKIFWAMGNYSRYIRPGSHRIYCTGADDKTGLMASSYIDSASTKIITVIINAADESEDVQFNFSGKQKVVSLTPYVTSDMEGDDLKAYPAFQAGSIYAVPAKSIVTVVGRIQ